MVVTQTPNVALSWALRMVRDGKASKVVVEFGRGEWLGLVPEARGSIPGWVISGQGRGLPRGEGCIDRDLYPRFERSGRLTLSIGAPSGPCRTYSLERPRAVRVSTLDGGRVLWEATA